MLREIWSKNLAELRKSLADVRQVQLNDTAFVESIDQSLIEIKKYETGISPIFEQIERAQLDGASGGAYADRLKIVSKERIMDEFNKILMTDKPSVGLIMLDQAKLLGTFRCHTTIWQQSPILYF